MRLRRVGGARYWAPVASGNAPKRPGTRGPTRPAARLPKPPSSSKLDGATELEATRQELREALERQTAISEILRVISRSPTEIQPVLDAIAENAARYCQAEDATVMLPDGPILRVVAHFGPVPLVLSGKTIGSFTYPIDRTSLNGRAFMERRALHTADILTEADQYPRGAEAMRKVGSREIGRASCRERVYSSV